MNQNLVLTATDEDVQKSILYFEKNINFLVKQCETGPKNISFMAGFSFLEGFLRHRFPRKLCFSIFRPKIKFAEMTEAYINYLNEAKKNIKSFKSKKDIEHSVLLLHDLTYTYSETNPIRHDFSMDTIEVGAYYKLFAQLKDFFILQGLNDEEYTKFDTILNDNLILKDQINGGFLQYFSDSNETFFQTYDDLMQFKNNKEILTSTLQDNILRGYSNIIPQFLKDYDDDYYREMLEKFSKDEEYFTKLTYAINQEYLGRDYHKEFAEMIEPNEAQESILKNCLNIIGENPNHYVLITGAPGTGKTIVLIRLLIQLMKSKKLSQLVTFSESLELYNKHFSSEYNKNSKEIPDSTMKDFQNNLIKSFKDWVKLPLRTFLKVEQFNDELNEIKLDRKIDREFFITQYQRAVSDIWPKLKDIDDDSEMQQLHKNLDELQIKNKSIPLEYAYWKFVKKITPEDMLPLIGKAQCPDYILIDEVQDLTLAQLECAKKIAKYGAVLAGDLNQCIGQNYSKWEELGIDASFGTELTHNFRTSYSIQLLSNLYLKESGKHTYTLVDENKIQGPKPQLFVSLEDNDYSYVNACKQIACSVDMLLNNCQRDMKDIFIVASTKDELAKIEIELKKRTPSIAVHRLKQKDNENKKLFSENSIKLGTIESIKGIDCPILLFLITQNLINSKAEPLIQDSIYSVINRAMHLLEVFMPCHDLKSKSVQDLIALLKSDKLNTEISLINNLHQFYPIRKRNDCIIGRIEDGREGSIKLDMLKKFSSDQNEILNSVFLVTIFDENHKLLYLTPRDQLDIMRGKVVIKADNANSYLYVQSMNKTYPIHKDHCKNYESLKEGESVIFDIREFTNAGGNRVDFAVDVKIIPTNPLFMNVPLS